MNEHVCACRRRGTCQISRRPKKQDQEPSLCAGLSAEQVHTRLHSREPLSRKEEKRSSKKKPFAVASARPPHTHKRYVRHASLCIPGARRLGAADTSWARVAAPAVLRQRAVHWRRGSVPQGQPQCTRPLSMPPDHPLMTSWPPSSPHAAWLPSPARRLWAEQALDRAEASS